MSAKTFLSKQNYLKELTILEHILLWLNVITSLVFFIIPLCWGKWAEAKTWLACISSILSIFAVMGCAKERVIGPFFGFVASILLIALAWINHAYGSMIMYCINIIIQGGSVIAWSRASKDKVSIAPKHVKTWITIIYLAVFVGLTGLFAWVEGLPGFVEFWSGGSQTIPESWPVRIFDSAILMFTIAGLVPMFKRYDLSWYTYIFANTAICLLWLTKGIEAIQSGTGNQFDCWTMFFSGLCMTAVDFIGLFNWRRSIKRNNKK